MDNQPLLLTVGAAAEFVGLPRRTWERLQAAGRVGPQPIRLGTRKLYRADDLVRWVNAGCPDRQTWTAFQTTGESPHELLCKSNGLPRRQPRRAAFHT